MKNLFNFTSAIQTFRAEIAQILSPPSAQEQCVVSPVSGKKFYVGRCYDAQGNWVEKPLSSQPYIGELMIFAPQIVNVDNLASFSNKIFTLNKSEK